MTRLVDRPHQDRSVHVLIVGVADYDGGEPPGLDGLPCVVASAERAARFWEGSEELLLNRTLSTVDVLLSPGPGGTSLRAPSGAPPEPAIFDNVQAAFNRWVHSCSATADCLAVLHWIGHGEAEVAPTRPNTPSIALFCQDREQLIGEPPIPLGISLSETIDSLKRMPFAQNTLCFIDACRTGSEVAYEFPSAVRLGRTGSDRKGRGFACITVAYNGHAAFCLRAGKRETGFMGGAVMTEAVLDALAHYGGREIPGEYWSVNAADIVEAVNARIDWWRDPLGLPETFKAASDAHLEIPLVRQPQPRCLVSLDVPWSVDLPPEAELAETDPDRCTHFNGKHGMPATSPLHLLGRTFRGDVRPSGWCPVVSSAETQEATVHNTHVSAIPPRFRGRWSP